MTKDQEKVIALVQLQIEPDETVDEGKIKELVEFFSKFDLSFRRGGCRNNCRTSI